MNFLSVILVIVGQSVLEAVPEFKKNAAEFMEVGFYKGRTGIRLSEIVVTVGYKEMFEGGEDVDIDDLSLEVKADDGCWTKIMETPIKRGNDKFSWRVKIAPCKEHFVRIGITRDGCVEYFQYPEAVEPSSNEEIAKSLFKPGMPENIFISPLGPDSVSVSWSPSECAESYELWYESELDSGNLTVSAGFGSVLVFGLENCTDYTLRIVALVGEKFSEEGESDFTTCQGEILNMPDTTIAERTDDLSCESIIRQCELPTLRFEESTSPDMFLLPGKMLDVSTDPETEFEVKSDTDAPTGQANNCYKSLLGVLVSQIVLILMVF